MSITFLVPFSTLFYQKMPPSEMSKSLDDMIKIEDPLESLPLFAGHQLLGDSILVRFAKNILQIPSKLVDRSATVGYCVSGQRISQLTRKIKEYKYKLEEKVIILIGTNDMLCGRPLETMKQHFDMLILLLQLRMVTHFVILTLPPIPKLALMEEYWACFHGFNSYLQRHHDPVHHFHVVDISAKFMKQDSPLFTPKLGSVNSMFSPKRKAESPLASTPKKRKGIDLLADDRVLSAFGVYINKVNRREWEEDAVSSGDEGYVPWVQHYIDESFWGKLKETIIVEDEYKLPVMTALPIASPTSSSKPRCSLETTNQTLSNPKNRRLIALVKNFIRLDFFELFFYNQRMDMVHPNEAGLRAIETMLNNLLGTGWTRRACSL